jgi:hypothetical protein
LARGATHKTNNNREKEIAMEHVYPAGPDQAPKELTAPSAAYKRNAWMAMLGLSIFVVCYFGMSFWFLWAACHLLGGVLRGGEQTFIALVGGVCSAFLAVFMLKAVIFIKRGAESTDIEVTATQEPKLFAFLNRLADESKAPRPHRVYLSPREFDIPIKEEP